MVRRTTKRREIRVREKYLLRSRAAQAVLAADEKDVAHGAGWSEGEFCEHDSTDALPPSAHPVRAQPV